MGSIHIIRVHLGLSKVAFIEGLLTSGVAFMRSSMDCTEQSVVRFFLHIAAE